VSSACEQHFSYIVTICFIVGGKQSTQRKPLNVVSHWSSTSQSRWAGN